MKLRVMVCPMRGCQHTLGVLDGDDVRPEDHLVTQYTLMALHLQDDHGGRVGGDRCRLPQRKVAR